MSDLWTCNICGARNHETDGECQFCEGEGPFAVTVLQLAEHILGRPASTEADFAEAGLPMLGGCQACGATITGYNAYPSKTGFLRCEDCLGDLGWPTVEEARIGVFEKG